MATDPLAPWRARIADPRHEELAEALLAWSLQHCSCQRGASWHAQEVYYATTFEHYCAPEDAADWEMLLCAKYLTFFLSQDDGAHSELTALADQLRSRSAVRAGELGNLYEGLLADMRAHSLDTTWVEAGVADLCAAAVTEADHDARTMMPEQFHAQRLATISTAVHINCRRAARGLPVPDEEHLVEQASEATYIVNDLASLDNDAASGGEGGYVTSNVVLFHAAHFGQELGEAIITVTDRYNQIAATLRDAPPSTLTTLLTSCVDGNLRAHVELATTRYPGAAKNLSHLQLVSTSPGQRSGHDA
jgi:hypothetical protein